MAKNKQWYDYVLQGVPLVGGLLGSIFGSKASDRAAGQSERAFGLEEEIWRNYGQPQAQMELQRMRQQQPYYNYLQNLASGMIGGPQVTQAPSNINKWLDLIRQTGQAQGSLSAGQLQVGAAQTTQPPLSQDEWLYQTYGGDRRYSPSYPSNISPEQINQQYQAYVNQQNQPGAGLPSWMNVPQGNVNLPEVPGLGTMPAAYRPGQDVYGALNTIGRMNLEDYMRQQAGNRAQLAQSQGIRISAEQARNAPGVQQGFLEAKSRESANAALTRSDLERQYANDVLNRYLQGTGLESQRWGQQLQRVGMQEDIGRSRRGEAAGNFWNLQNVLSGYPSAPWQTAGNWAGYLGQLGQNYQNQAANYGQALGQGLNAMGQAYGQWQGYKSMNPYMPGGQNQNPRQTWMTNYTNPYENRYGPGF